MKNFTAMNTSFLLAGLNDANTVRVKELIDQASEAYFVEL